MTNMPVKFRLLRYIPTLCGSQEAWVSNIAGQNIRNCFDSMEILDLN